LNFLAMGEVVRRLGAGQEADFLGLVEAVDDNDAPFERLPLTDVPFVDELAPFYRRWLEHPDYDDYWRQIAPKERWSEITVPTLNIGGWYDLFIGGTIANYVGMKRTARPRRRGDRG
jgi:predicted acyl esterase